MTQEELKYIDNLLTRIGQLKEISDKKKKYRKKDMINFGNYVNQSHFEKETSMKMIFKTWKKDGGNK